MNELYTTEGKEVLRFLCDCKAIGYSAIAIQSRSEKVKASEAWPFDAKCCVFGEHPSPTKISVWRLDTDSYTKKIQIVGDTIFGNALEYFKGVYELESNFEEKIQEIDLDLVCKQLERVL